MEAGSTYTLQQSGMIGDCAPDLTTMGGAIMHFPDPQTGEWAQMTVREYAATPGNHIQYADGTSGWSGPWVAQIRQPRNSQMLPDESSSPTRRIKAIFGRDLPGPVRMSEAMLPSNPFGGYHVEDPFFMRHAQKLAFSARKPQ